jgi:hypothetical protein
MKVKKFVLRFVGKVLWSICLFVWPFHTKWSSFIFQNLSSFVIGMDNKHKLDLWPEEEED